MAQAAPVDQGEGLPTPPFVQDDPFVAPGEPQDPALVRSMANPGDPARDEGEEWEAPTQDEWEEQEARTARAEEAATNAQSLVSRSQELIAQAVSGQAAPPAVVEPLGPPPNPADDPEAFGKWLNTRDDAFERKIVASMNQVQDNIGRMNTANDLYSNFLEKYPALKDTPNVRDLMIVAGKAAGVNANDPQEKIFKAVEDQFGAWGIDTGAKPNGHDPAANRTGGVGGGSGRRRRRSAKPETVVPVDLVDQITQDQVRLGLA